MGCIETVSVLYIFMKGEKILCIGFFEWLITGLVFKKVFKHFRLLLKNTITHRSDQTWIVENLKRIWWKDFNISTIYNWYCRTVPCRDVTFKLIQFTCTWLSCVYISLWMPLCVNLKRQLCHFCDDASNTGNSQ